MNSKLLSVVAGGMILSLMACDGGAKEASSAEDSVAKEAAAAEAAAKAVEHARLDSINAARQDSVRRDSIAKVVVAKFPKASEIISAADNRTLMRMLKKKGFTVNGKMATLNEGEDVSCIVTQLELGWSVTINGAPEALAAMAAGCKSYVARQKSQFPDDWWYQEWKYSKNGNTVKVFIPYGD